LFQIDSVARYIILMVTTASRWFEAFNKYIHFSFSLSTAMQLSFRIAIFIFSLWVSLVILTIYCLPDLEGINTIYNLKPHQGIGAVMEKSLCSRLEM